MRHCQWLLRRRCLSMCVFSLQCAQSNSLHPLLSSGLCLCVRVKKSIRTIASGLGLAAVFPRVCFLCNARNRVARAVAPADCALFKRLQIYIFRELYIDKQHHLIRSNMGNHFLISGCLCCIKNKQNHHFQGVKWVGTFLMRKTQKGV